jgi:hypothetical protein
LSSTPSRGHWPGRDEDAPVDEPNDGFSPTSADLGVVLAELNRVRHTKDPDALSPGEAMTLAATAVRMVEAQLARAGLGGLAPAEIAAAREVLQGALEALLAAVRLVDGEPAPAANRRFRKRRQRRHVGG